MDKAIFSECFSIEKQCRAQVAVKLLIVGFVESACVDAQIFQNTAGHVAVLSRTFNRLGSTIAKQHSAARLKLVALGMSAEIVVIVENENAAFLARLLLIKIGRGKAANAAPDDHQVVDFIGLARNSIRIP